MAEELNQDGKKADWLQRILSKEESSDFLLAQGMSLLYSMLIRKQEPSKDRSDEIRSMMVEFIEDIQKILERHSQSEKIERDVQVEGLIRQANFSGELKHSSTLYYHFRRLTDHERKDWNDRRLRLEKEMFGFDFRIFDE